MALVSTIMPQSNKDAADGYRWSLMITAAVTLIFSLSGLLPAAILSAAFLVPLVYLVYLYDVNVWEDTPLPVVASVMLVTGALSTLVSIVFFRWIFDTRFLALAAGTGDRGGSFGDIDIIALLLFVLALPVIAEICKQIGPVLMARRAMFSDQMDALTFGVAAGTTYAAFETVVSYAPVFASGTMQTTDGLVSWLVVVFNLMIVKSLIYGTATGIALAAFSGRGEGIDGFRPAYYAHVALAMGANVVYWLGVRLFSYVAFGQALALVWGLLILGVLIVKIRTMLQSALLDEAIEAAVEGRRPAGATTDSGFCPNCETELLPDSMFCIVCGMSVRATSATGRRHVREAVAGGAR
jgi:hypothetical protein